MLPFYVLIFLPFFICFSPIRMKNKERNAMIIFFIMLAMLMAFRHAIVGNDTTTYLRIFQRLRNISWETVVRLDLETGYLFLSKIITYFTANNQVYLSITSIIIVFPIAYVYCKSSENSFSLLKIAVFLVLPTSSYV